MQKRPYSSLVFPSSYNGSTSIVTIPYGAWMPPLTGPMTVMAQLYLRGTGGGAFGYIASNCTSGLANGWRIFYNGGALTFGSSSTTLASPFRSTSAATFNTGAFYTVAATYDGGVVQSGINMYIAADGNALALDNGGGGGDGTGSVDSSANQALNIGNRAGAARCTDGDIFWFGWWPRILDIGELRAVRRQNLLTIPPVFLWANGRDYGPYGAIANAKTAITTPPSSSDGKNQRFHTKN